MCLVVNQLPRRTSGSSRLDGECWGPLGPRHSKARDPVEGCGWAEERNVRKGNGVPGSIGAVRGLQISATTEYFPNGQKMSGDRGYCTAVRRLRATIRHVAGGTDWKVRTVGGSTWTACALLAASSRATRARYHRPVAPYRMHSLMRLVQGVSRCCVGRVQALGTTQALAGMDSPYRPSRMQPQGMVPTDPSHHGVLADYKTLDHPCAGVSEDTQSQSDQILNLTGDPKCG